MPPFPPEFGAVLILFAVVGTAMWINILYGLITGGPRARKWPGAPYLYTRFFYLFYGIGLIGWTFCILSSLAEIKMPKASFGFLTGWSVCAIGLGLWFWVCVPMFVQAARYRAQYGFVILRPMWASQAKQFSRLNPALRKLIAGIFIAVGCCILVFCLPHLPQALHEAHAGLSILFQAVLAVKFPV